MKNQEVIEAESQLTPAQMKEHLGKLIAESPSRQRGRFIPNFQLTKEYEELSGVDTSGMSDKQIEEHTTKLSKLKREGTYTDEMRQAEIDNSLAIPLSEVIRLRDKHKAEISRLEQEIDSFDISAVQAEADKIEAEFKQRMRGVNSHQRTILQAEYNKAIDSLELEHIHRPKNALKVARYEAIERYKVYENRVKLYVSLNKDAIENVNFSNYEDRDNCGDG